MSNKYGSKYTYGFIYKIEGDYALRMANCLYFLSDEINDIETDVEIGNIDEKNILEDYALKLKKIKQEWQIIDTGHKNCKNVIASGKYGNNFEKSIEKFLKVFK